MARNIIIPVRPMIHSNYAESNFLIAFHNMDRLTYPRHDKELHLVNPYWIVPRNKFLDMGNYSRCITH